MRPTSTRSGCATDRRRRGRSTRSTVSGCSRRSMSQPTCTSSSATSPARRWRRRSATATRRGSISTISRSRSDGRQIKSARRRRTRGRRRSIRSRTSTGTRSAGRATKPTRPLLSTSSRPSTATGMSCSRHAPAEEGTVRRICDRLGYISGNNFGWTFDVRAEPRPTDLAYTAIKLLAHTDQPYRQPVPGIQLLHCLRNGAPGGDSTLADGLGRRRGAAPAADPAAHAAFVECETEFRYDMVTDTVVTYGTVLEYDHGGRFRQIRLNTKLDAPLPRPEYDLDAYYRGRRCAQRVAQRPHPPGDVQTRAGRGDVRRQLPRAPRAYRVRRLQGHAPPAGGVHRSRRTRHDVPPRRAAPAAESAESAT